MDKKKKVIRMIMVIAGEILIAALAIVLFVHFALINLHYNTLLRIRQ